MAMSPTQPAATSTNLFTIGRLDAGMALLLSSAHHIIEFPAILLPPNISTGCVVSVSVLRETKEEIKRGSEFQQLQDMILEKYGSHTPLNPVIKMIKVGATNCIIEWDPLDVKGTNLKGIEVWKGQVRLSIPKWIDTSSSSASSSATNKDQHIQSKIQTTSSVHRLSENTVRLSSLNQDEKYSISLNIRTTAGQYISNQLNIKTKKSDDLETLWVAFGPGFTDENKQSWVEKLKTANISCSTTLQVENTHLVLGPDVDPATLKDDVSPDWVKLKETANQWNIPIVQFPWLEKCLAENKVVGVGEFYMSNPTKQDTLLPKAESNTGRRLSVMTTSSTTRSHTSTKDPSSPLEINTQAYNKKTSPLSSPNSDKPQPSPLSDSPKKEAKVSPTSPVASQPSPQTAKSLTEGKGSDQVQQPAASSVSPTKAAEKSIYSSGKSPQADTAPDIPRETKTNDTLVTPVTTKLADAKDKLSADFSEDDVVDIPLHSANSVDG